MLIVHSLYILYPCYAHVQLKYAAVANTDARINHEKREAKSEFQPIRIKPFFDSSVEDLSIEKQSFVKVSTLWGAVALHM